MKQLKMQSGVILYACLFALAFSAAGCMSVTLISSYDEKIDEWVSALQKKTDAFLVRLERTCETAEGAYEHHITFYDDAKVDLSAIRVRADAIALNSLTCKQLDILEDSFQRMESQHKTGFTPIVVTETRTLMNVTFTGILRLERGKK